MIRSLLVLNRLQSEFLFKVAQYLMVSEHDFDSSATANLKHQNAGIQYLPVAIIRGISIIRDI